MCCLMSKARNQVFWKIPGFSHKSHPPPLEVGLDQRLGRIRVRSMAFSIDGDLEQAGQAFVRMLVEALGFGVQT